MTGKAPSTPAMEAAREIHEHEVKRRSKSAVVIHVDCEAKILAIAAILDRHFPSREPQGAQHEHSSSRSDNSRSGLDSDPSGAGCLRCDCNPNCGCECHKAALISRDRELREMREALQAIVEQAEYQRGTIYEISTSLYEKAQDVLARAERVREQKEGS